MEEITSRTLFLVKSSPGKKKWILYIIRNRGINIVYYTVAAFGKLTKTNIQIHPLLIHLTVQQPLVCTRSPFSSFLYRFERVSIYDVEIIFTQCTHFVTTFCRGLLGTIGITGWQI